jgi:pimeloyl-ACP methyl ester carboxylesterase
MRIVLTACLFLILAADVLTESPEPPGYEREEIRFASGRFTLVGDLLTPQHERPLPAVVYVWGSGPTNRNRHIDRSLILKSFLESGFAVLLYDKPGSGQSTGEFDNSRLFEERAAILIDAIGFLKRHAAIDAEAIGLYGSSQASYVMAVALARTKDVAFMIAWSCPMENSIEQSAYLVRNYALCAGSTPVEADAAERAFRQRGRARSYPEYLAAAKFLDSVPAIRDSLGWAGVVPEEDFAPADTTSESFLDPGVVIASLAIPFLALFAENDRQIDPVQGAAAYRRLLAGSDQELSTVTVIPGADHNMNLSPRGCMQDQRDGYRSLGGATLSPVFLETVAEWLGRLKPQLGRS